MRKPVPDEITANAIRFVEEQISLNLEKSGDDAFVSRYEILSSITKQWKEVTDSIQEEENERVKSKLADLAMVCIWSMASIDVGLD